MKTRGRPKLAKGTGKTSTVTLRLLPIELKAIASAAQRAGVGQSEWMRATLMQAACLPVAPAARPLPLPPVPIPTGRNVWTYSEDGGTVRLDTPADLSRKLWERLSRYAAMLEPVTAEPATILQERG